MPEDCPFEVYTSHSLHTPWPLDLISCLRFPLSFPRCREFSLALSCSRPYRMSISLRPRPLLLSIRPFFVFLCLYSLLDLCFANPVLFYLHLFTESLVERTFSLDLLDPLYPTVYISERSRKEYAETLGSSSCLWPQRSVSYAFIGFVPPGNFLMYLVDTWNFLQQLPSP